MGAGGGEHRGQPDGDRRYAHLHTCRFRRLCAVPRDRVPEAETEKSGAGVDKIDRYMHKKGTAGVAVPFSLLLFDDLSNNTVPVLVRYFIDLLVTESDTFHFFNDIWNFGSVLQTDRVRVGLAAE